MADLTWAFADDPAPAPQSRNDRAVDREPDSFHRWVNRRWPQREQREPAASEA